MRVRTVAALGLTAAAAAGAAVLARRAFPGRGTPGTGVRGSLFAGEQTRTFLVYLPDDLLAGAPLVIVFHGSDMDGAMMQRTCGWQFERLADEHKFAVVYPDGYKRNWNDDRTGADYAAAAMDIDDEAFTLTLIDHCESEYGIDHAKVCVAGYSSGGHMVFRLAMDLPELFTAGAAIAANLPTPSNNKLELASPAFPMVIINGTRDPMNPYAGGDVALWGVLASRGQVMSSMETGAAFERASGHEPEPLTALDDSQAVQRTIFGPSAHVISIVGGGHQVHNPVTRGHRFLGPTLPEVNVPELAWQFFERVLSRANG